jgi:hypothetical protein
MLKTMPGPATAECDPPAISPAAPAAADPLTKIARPDGELRIVAVGECSPGESLAVPHEDPPAFADDYRRDFWSNALLVSFLVAIVLCSFALGVQLSGGSIP